ncbi:hypothetical protein JW948_16455 [bacterium]|nr:hypothetical protein [bacterium]
MENYIEYNREERNLCAHLFRLLLEDQPNWGPLKAFLGIDSIINPQVYCEVALIRDAYDVRKPHIQTFVESLCEIIARQHNVQSYTNYQKLSENLKDPKETHPKQIKYKLQEAGQLKSEGDRSVYGNLQAVFNAKPDLAICYNDNLIVFEAKFQSHFSEEQLKRTRQIAQIWAELLYKDLGFDVQPNIVVRTLGLSGSIKDLDMSWEKVYEIARQYWGDEDFSVRVFERALNFGIQ